MPESYETRRNLAVAALAEARAMLNAEISAYPTPIAGCDAQFNHLIADRRRLGDALLALESDVFVPTPRMPVPAPRLESR